MANEPASKTIPPEPKDDAKSDAKAPVGTPAEAAKEASKPSNEPENPGSPAPTQGVASPLPARAVVEGSDGQPVQTTLASDEGRDARRRVDLPADVPGLRWTQEDNARGHVITVTKEGAEGATTTREAVLPLGAKPEEIEAAVGRLQKTFVEA